MNNIYITKADLVGNLSVMLYFSDNTSKTINVGEYIIRHPHPQYNKYLDPKKFASFKIEDGNIVWGRDWDLIFPIEQLHSGHID